MFVERDGSGRPPDLLISPEIPKYPPSSFSGFRAVFQK
jgi:hypothetical protein